MLECMNVNSADFFLNTHLINARNMQHIKTNYNFISFHTNSTSIQHFRQIIFLSNLIKWLLWKLL
jgi:hypothetical protein